jgi:hypothetical protein
MTKVFINSFLTLLFVSLLACNNDDDAAGGQAILQNDTSNTTGKLIIRVIDQNGNTVNGVRVSLYGTYEDLQNDIWIYDLFNDSRGEADFGFINIGNYYIFADENGSNRTNNPGDVAQVRSQKTTIREVVIR